MHFPGDLYAVRGVAHRRRRAGAVGRYVVHFHQKSESLHRAQQLLLLFAGNASRAEYLFAEPQRDAQQHGFGHFVWRVAVVDAFNQQSYGVRSDVDRREIQFFVLHVSERV